MIKIKIPPLFELLPAEIRTKMLEAQSQAGNVMDSSVFIKQITADKRQGGFTWAEHSFMKQAEKDYFIPYRKMINFFSSNRYIDTNVRSVFKDLIKPFCKVDKEFLKTEKGVDNTHVFGFYLDKSTNTLCIVGGNALVDPKRVKTLDFTEHFKVLKKLLNESNLETVRDHTENMPMPKEGVYKGEDALVIYKHYFKNMDHSVSSSKMGNIFDFNSFSWFTNSSGVKRFRSGDNGSVVYTKEEIANFIFINTKTETNEKVSVTNTESRGCTEGSCITSSKTRRIASAGRLTGNPKTARYQRAAIVTTKISPKVISF